MFLHLAACHICEAYVILIIILNDTNFCVLYIYLSHRKQIMKLTPEACITRIESVLHFLQLGNRNGFHRIVFTCYFTQLILYGIRQIIKQIHIYLGVITLNTGKNFHARYLIECPGYDIAF